MKTVIEYAPVALEHPDDYEARANLMWASSWAINGMIGALQKCVWSCHQIEHELSAIYDITHGLGLAIVTPRWMRYVLDEDSAPLFREYGVNVFGVDPALPAMEAAEKSIALTEGFPVRQAGLGFYPDGYRASMPATFPSWPKKPAAAVFWPVTSL